MPEIKRLEPLTEWITYEFVETALLAEPNIRLRLRYLDNLDAADEYIRNGLRRPLAMAALAIQAVEGWDLTEAGKPIPVNEETKLRFLRPLLGLILKEPEAELTVGDKKDEDEDTAPRKVLAYEIVAAAQNLENFRKN